MKPGKLDLPTIWRGCTWSPVLLKWKNENGTPFNLNGWTPYASTRGGFSLNAVVTNAADGETRISMPRVLTEQMPLGVQQWDWVWWQNAPTGTKYPPILSGTVLVDQPTTHNFPVPPGELPESPEFP